MTMPDANRPDLSDGEGERFLADLDAALAGKRAPAEHPYAAELRLALRAATNLPAPGARPSRASLPAASRRSWIAVWLAAAALIAFAAGCFFTLLVHRPEAPQAIADSDRKTSVAEEPEKETEKAKEGEPPAPEPKAGPSKVDRAVMEKLAKKVSFEFADVPLTEALEFLSSLTDVVITFDPQLGAKGNGKWPVNLTLKETPASAALAWIGRLTHTEYVVSRGAVFLSTKDRIEELVFSEICLETYDVGGLSAAPAEVAAAARSILLAPHASNKNLTLVEHNGKLVAMLNPPLHAELAGLLQGLRAKGDWPPPRPKEPWEVRIQKILDEKLVQFEFDDAPLDDALGLLSSLAGINIVLDTDLKAARPPVSLRVDKMPLRTALDYIVVLAGQKYVVENDAVYVASAERLKPAKELRVYDIGVLAKGGKSSIANLVKDSIRQGIWSEGLGATAVELGDRLAVRTTPDVQALVRTLLKKLAEKP